MAIEQIINGELERKLEGFIERREQCRIVVKGTNPINTHVNDFYRRTGLTYKSEREPKVWASFATLNFPDENSASYARSELRKTTDYKRMCDPKIQIDIMSEQAFDENYPKVRSVYATRNT